MSVKSLVFFVAIFATLTLAKVKFTNIKCKGLDENFFVFDKCELKMIRRGTVALYLHGKILQGPVSNITLAGALFKKVNGYRPFLYNITIDFCMFMKNKKKNPMLKVVADMLPSFSNINHTCPYNNDIDVHDLVLTDEMLKLMPLPTGEYMLQLKTYVFNEPKTVFKAYFQQIE